MRKALVAISRIGTEIWMYAAQPGQLGMRRRAPEHSGVPAWEALVFCTAAILLLFIFYRTVFGVVFDQLASVRSEAAAFNSKAEDRADDLQAQITDISFGFGFVIRFPEFAKKTSDQPQTVVFKMGLVVVTMDNVVPGKLSQILLPLIVVFAFSAILCFHGPVRLLGGTGSLPDAIGLSVTFLSYTVLFAIIILTWGTFLVYTLQLTGWVLMCVRIVFLDIPAVILPVRAFFAAFGSFYQIPKTKVLLSILFSIPVSLVVSPAVFIPGAFLIVRSEPILDILF